MAPPGADIMPDTTTSTHTSSEDELASSVSRIAVQDEASQTEPPNPEKKTTLSQQMRIYTRPQLLFLHNSPLVNPPPDMPELKDWFGDNDQNPSKKESEPVTPSTARERRFRRDAEDGENPSRPTFRSTLSQPSQMGNFKHHSLRGSDRDRDRDRERDGDKDREREQRDKEGQERLRHLSDKYDRDRLALPLTGPRNKERDAAPHLAASSTSRLGTQPQAVPAPRRAETREAAKKKAGEASEDWRRGAEPRSGREERSDSGRKDRDERPRSRVRDSSRSRRDTSPSRRERDRDREVRDKGRDRDELRPERERDPDRDFEEDARRWRDDGKRDERMAARRGDRNSEQHRAREKDPAWDSASDRRWVPAEERDVRPKRAGRERKTGQPGDDGKERDDRRDREREREREKEPAWMDAYIPPPSSAGILGGKGGEGELDGIQAWKKERREKELKEQGPPSTAKEHSADTQETHPQKSDINGLDEIQIFKLLMKREQGGKKGDGAGDAQQTDSKSSSSAKPRPLQSISMLSSDNTGSGPLPISSPELRPSPTATPHSLLSLLGSKESTNSLNSPSSLEAPPGGPVTPVSSRAPEQALPEASTQNIERSALDSVSPQFNPPPGSRLLAFARAPSGTRSQIGGNSPSLSTNGSFQATGTSPEPTPHHSSKPDTLLSSPGFSPFEDHSRSTFGSEGQRELGSFAGLSDNQRRTPGERSPFTPSSEHASFQDVPLPMDNGTGHSSSKGSRFAKFFDGRGREGNPQVTKPYTPGNNLSSSPGPGGQRQEHSDFNGIHGGSHDPRAMDDIYAMLNSSAQQGPRGAPVHLQHSAQLSSNGFGLQGQNNLHLLQQQQQILHQQQQHHQQQMHASRLEPLYESRLDNRNFMPDGMVPGLRSAPPRNRENIGMYPDGLDDGIHFNVQRIPQQRTPDQYSGLPPSIYAQQGIRNPGVPLQPHYRGGPSPISNQQNHLPTSQQRLPPGLANLGGRPPHEPSQFLGMPGMPSPGLHSGLHLNGSAQQQSFNNFPPGGTLGYGGGPPIRVPHQLQNPGPHHPMGHPNNIDLRAASQNQLLGMGSSGGGLRGAGFPGQQGPNAHLPGPLLAMRQQQPQQQLPPHMMPHLLPHLQQQGLPGPNNQPAHDLMALLMGGSHRE